MQEPANERTQRTTYITASIILNIAAVWIIGFGLGNSNTILVIAGSACFVATVVTFATQFRGGQNTDGSVNTAASE